MKIAIIGAGNMGGSIAAAWQRKSDSRLRYHCIQPQRRQTGETEEEFPGISTTLSNTEAATGADVVILAVKLGLWSPSCAS